MTTTRWYLGAAAIVLVFANAACAGPTSGPPANAQSLTLPAQTNTDCRPDVTIQAPPEWHVEDDGSSLLNYDEIAVASLPQEELEKLYGSVAEMNLYCDNRTLYTEFTGDWTLDAMSDYVWGDLFASDPSIKREASTLGDYPAVLFEHASNGSLFITKNAIVGDYWFAVEAQIILGPDEATVVKPDTSLRDQVDAMLDTVSLGTSEDPSEAGGSTGIKPDLDLATLLPEWDEVTLTSDVQASAPREANAPVGGSDPAPQFGIRSCDGLLMPPYFPQSLDATTMFYRDFGGGNSIEGATVVRFESTAQVTDILTSYSSLIAFCDEHAGEEVYGVDEAISADDSTPAYRVVTSGGERFLYSGAGNYVIQVKAVSEEDESALLSEILDRIRGS